MTSTGNCANDYTTLNNNHYTCFSTGNKCSSVYYIYNMDTDKAYYITLSGGKKLDDAFDDMFTNTTNSTAKTQIDNWYSSNMTSYTNYIEDTVYCNDRSMGWKSGWDPNGGDGTTGGGLHFIGGWVWNTGYSPNLNCSRASDRFTVSSSIGNGKLTYPVGLITSFEIWYAGGRGGSGNSSYYLYNNVDSWTMTPNDVLVTAGITNEFKIYANGAISGDYGSIIGDSALRPVISLKSTDVVESGDGTATNPYVIKTS